MSYFDEKDNAQEYIKMSMGYDGTELINVLQEYLPKGASVLELGMGPGKDLDILKPFYQATGSDSSHAFLEIYRKEHEDTDLIFLDASTIETSRKFDSVYSNKVMIHLSEEELRQSFEAQNRILNPGGILFHTFWHGDTEEIFHGLRFRYITEQDLLLIVEPQFDVLEISRYTEMEIDDSIHIVLMKP